MMSCKKSLILTVAVSILLVFVLLSCGMAAGEISAPTLQILRGDEYSDWTLLHRTFIDKDHSAALLVCEKGDKTAVIIAEKAEEDYVVVARNDILFGERSVERENFAVGDHPYVWYIGENMADTFYLTMGKNEAGVWQITSGFFGDEYVDDYSAFFLTNNGTALGISDVIMWQPQVYVPLEWDMTLQGFDPRIIRAACKEAIIHKGEPGIIPSTLEPNALPQGNLITLRDNQAYPVYTGPGEEYLRLVGGLDTDNPREASVSNESWIQAIGQENGWVLIRYDSMRGIHRVNRFGYIQRSAFADDAEIPALTWLPYDAVMSGWLEGDPLTAAGDYYYFCEEQSCRVLATMGDQWLYVEVYDGKGVGYRGFLQKR
ncbi:MAG: hypothetical protein FWF86_04645 [Clostridia bacterium]|nr:hypothetical protein [Clostridia bacterium]